MSFADLFGNPYEALTETYRPHETFYIPPAYAPEFLTDWAETAVLRTGALQYGRKPPVADWGGFDTMGRGVPYGYYYGSSFYRRNKTWLILLAVAAGIYLFGRRK